MLSNLAKTVVNLGNPSVLLVGDFMLDSYLYGTVSRISPEAPVPLLKVDSWKRRPGGAGSVAMDLSQLGAKVTCIGIVGNDNNANILREQLTKSQIDISGLITVAERPTTSKQRIVGLAHHHQRQQLMRIDDEMAGSLGDKVNTSLIHMFIEKLANCQIVCLQDYNKGVLSALVCQHIIELAKKTDKRVLVDPGPEVEWEKYKGASLIKPNRNEAAQAACFSIHTIADVEKAAHLIQEKYCIEIVVITLDRDGTYLKEQNEPGQHYPAKTKDVYDITGAGDVALATLTMCLEAGCDCGIAVQISNIAAGIEIEKLGSVPVSRGEIINTLVSHYKSETYKIWYIETLKPKLDMYRQQNKKIVFTNGCFDVLHRGHIELLEFCKAQGDLVIIGLNSDSSVRTIKGPDRPINNQYDRAAILAALETVDYVTVFDEPDPLSLIKKVKPDVLVKGQDWAQKGVVGREFVESYGGKVVLAPLVEGKSSTATIKKIKALEKNPMDDESKKQIIEAIETHKKMIAELEVNGARTLAAASEAIIKSLKQNGRVYICGNGGSAADAQHIAAELVGRFEREREGLPAVALTTDTSVLTSVSNDYGYENAFARQVEALVREGDIFWAISTSGTSANVIEAAQLAKQKGARVLAFTGRANSKLEQIADVCFCAYNKSTARSQEIHQLAYHIICQLVERSFCEQLNQK